tara:strand:- start:1417 stop:2565 length:1149 start_codon:yes stop_codon:yes gene_type:complete
MSDIFFGTEELLKSPASKGKVKKKGIKLSTTESLNLGNVSKELTLNDGEEGLCKIRPKALRPSSHNPRPDWYIDDEWLKKHVKVDFTDLFESEIEGECLVKIHEIEEKGEIVEKAVFPTFKALIGSPNPNTEKQFEFLVELAKSIRDLGQVQPIEVETDHERKCFVVLEGHLRRLACILGRLPFIKAVRNEGLQEVSKEVKIERQITENSIRKSLTPFGIYKLASSFIDSFPSMSTRVLAEKLKISNTYAAIFKKLVVSKSKFTPLLYVCLEKDLLSTKGIQNVSIAKSIKSQELIIKKYLGKEYDDISGQTASESKKIKKEGRKRTVSTLRISSEESCIKAGNKLISLFPDLAKKSELDSVSSVEDMDKVLSELINYLLEE